MGKGMAGVVWLCDLGNEGGMENERCGIWFHLSLDFCFCSCYFAGLLVVGSWIFLFSLLAYERWGSELM